MNKNKKRYLSKGYISYLCDKFGFTYTIAANTVFIKTAFSRWIIFIDDYHVTRVKHENYKNQWRNSQKKCIENYHTHNLKTTSFYDVACYIKRHDERMLKNYGSKTNKLDALLDQVTEERLKKEKTKVSNL